MKPKQSFFFVFFQPKLLTGVVDTLSDINFITDNLSHGDTKYMVGISETSRNLKNEDAKYIDKLEDGWIDQCDRLIGRKLMYWCR